MHQGINKITAKWPQITSLILHHSPKGDPEGSSGSNRLEGWADVHLVVTMHARNNRDNALKSMEKWGPDDNQFTYTNIRLLARRNKVWATPDPLYFTLQFREETINVLKTPDLNTPPPGATPVNGTAYAGANKSVWTPAQEMREIITSIIKNNPDEFGVPTSGISVVLKRLHSDETSAVSDAAWVLFNFNNDKALYISITRFMKANPAVFTSRIVNKSIHWKLT